MKSTGLVRVRVRTVVVFLLLFALTAPLLGAEWQRQDVDWQAGGGRRIKGIQYPKGSPLPTQEQMQARQAAKERISVAEAPEEMLVESPPIDGFVPWIAVSITKQRGDDLELEASIESSVKGSYPTGVNPQTDYIIGLFDTGASAHVIGYADATLAGLYKGLVTSNQTVISGVTGSEDAYIS